MNTVRLLIAGVECDVAHGYRVAAQIEARIHEFTDLRWITVQHGPRHYPI